MSVRAKFKCTSVQKGSGGQVRLEAVMSGSAENEQFFQYTPGGSIDLAIVNPEAAEQFIEGQEYYVDFTKASS